MDKVLKGIGSRIRQARINEKLSQADLAEILSVSVPHISDIERGRTNCSITIFAAIDEKLNVSADWLLNVNTPPSKYYRQCDLTSLLEDCTAVEADIILNTVSSLKSALISARPENDGYS